MEVLEQIRLKNVKHNRKNLIKNLIVSGFIRTGEFFDWGFVSELKEVRYISEDRNWPVNKCQETIGKVHEGKGRSRYQGGGGR